jgi:hypothetical protein
MIYTIFYRTILSCFQIVVYVFECLFCPWQRTGTILVHGKRARVCLISAKIYWPSPPGPFSSIRLQSRGWEPGCRQPFFPLSPGSGRTPLLLVFQSQVVASSSGLSLESFHLPHPLARGSSGGRGELPSRLRRRWSGAEHPGACGRGDDGARGGAPLSSCSRRRRCQGAELPHVRALTHDGGGGRGELPSRGGGGGWGRSSPAVAAVAVPGAELP